MQLGKLRFDPSANPAILDTATWDCVAAWQLVEGLGAAYWSDIVDAATAGAELPLAPAMQPFAPSLARQDGSVYFLAALSDGQQIFVGLGSGGTMPLGTPLGRKAIAGTLDLSVYPTDAAIIDRFCRALHPAKGPRALGAVPRLGLGCRMSTSGWPGYYQAMHESGFAANTIQNSVRELHLLDDLRHDVPPEINYAPNFGTIESGHTGSTFEGLWTYGVLAALAGEGRPVYGADADHIKVKPGAGLVRCREVLAAARYYTFFTMDVSAVLNYGALAADDGTTAEMLDRLIPDILERRAVFAYHREAGGQDEAVARFICKYWESFAELDSLTAYIRELKGEQAFDLEFAIDEVPSGWTACSCVTSDAELLFVINESRRRGLPLTHVAPNFGIEKEVDYRCDDGLDGLERRVRRQIPLAEDSGLMLDFHSGDDLSDATIAVIGRATAGRNHFKISPSLQLLFADTLCDYHPEVFRRWWDDTLAYAQREAEAGSSLAAACLASYAALENPHPSAHHSVFHHYNFAAVGRRNADGQFVLRDALYSLPPSFYRAHRERLRQHLNGLAVRLFA